MLLYPTPNFLFHKEIDLKCNSYCHPGCSVSMNLARQCEDYVTSVVVGNDIIPKIRGSNFEML